MTPRALVAVNYPRLCQVIARNLAHFGFDVDQCRSSSELVERLGSTRYDAYVIEPEFDTDEAGHTRAAQLYELVSAGRVLFITNRPYTAEQCRQRGIGCVSFVDLTLEHQRALLNANGRYNGNGH